MSEVTFEWKSATTTAGPILIKDLTFMSTFGSGSQTFCYDKPIYPGKSVSLERC